MTQDKEQATKAMEELLWGELTSRFKGVLEFGPIVVTPRIDLDGTAYLHAHVVFEGDQDDLDPRWVIRLYERLWLPSEKLGYPGIPMQSFVPKSEWPDLERRLASTR